MDDLQLSVEILMAFANRIEVLKKSHNRENADKEYWQRKIEEAQKAETFFKRIMVENDFSALVEKYDDSLEKELLRIESELE